MSPSGDRTVLITVKHPGGSFTAPYVLPAGYVLVLSVLDHESLPRFDRRGPGARNDDPSGRS